MTATYDCIATTTLNSSANSVEFTSISGSFTDLILVAQPIGTSSEDIRCRVNGDTGSNYSTTYMTINELGTVYSYRRTSQTASSVGFLYSGLNTSAGAPLFIHFMNYSNTTTNKTWLARSGQGDRNSLDAGVSLWRSTSAITSIKVIYNNSANFSSGSTFTLYGIKSE